jgi:shikimate dehydrogenase
MMGPSPASTARPAIRLGLIGGNIAASRSPDLHRLSGQATGLDVTYDLLVPTELGTDFETVFAGCRDGGMRGVNVTYPYKERVTSLVSIPDPEVARLGSINTVLFAPGTALGYNTDYSGFAAAYRAAFADRPAGRVALVGAGGVGRAIAFALAGLGASELRLLDADPRRAQDLAAALGRLSRPAPRIVVLPDVASALGDADGVLNCTPMGMTGQPGSAIEASLLGGQRWAFDAVYTPVDTEFLIAARRAGLATISGYELFFHQGIEAFELFTGRTPPDLDDLRRQLRAPNTRTSS